MLLVGVLILEISGSQTYAPIHTNCYIHVWLSWQGCIELVESTLVRRIRYFYDAKVEVHIVVVLVNKHGKYRYE